MKQLNIRSIKQQPGTCGISTWYQYWYRGCSSILVIVFTMITAGSCCGNRYIMMYVCLQRLGGRSVLFTRTAHSHSTVLILHQVLLSCLVYHLLVIECSRTSINRSTRSPTYETSRYWNKIDVKRNRYYYFSKIQRKQCKEVLYYPKSRKIQIKPIKYKITENN